MFSFMFTCTLAIGSHYAWTMILIYSFIFCQVSDYPGGFVVVSGGFSRMVCLDRWLVIIKLDKYSTVLSNCLLVVAC